MLKEKSKLQCARISIYSRMTRFQASIRRVDRSQSLRHYYQGKNLYKQFAKEIDHI
jgi:hypothetical protein